ncbi:hypothetical protein JD844_015234 [Phrynosoma platyrhinos]|uniref:RRM domain-containing protein n=1 Tax=Phrynosoma platyrhinos TaxID=52577 RepID=A0ABQ7T7W6_PHRPL|nr:hypothetical protein JD844_015234 [Phrynosoma platyrhinos]
MVNLVLMAKVLTEEEEAWSTCSPLLFPEPPGKGEMPSSPSGLRGAQSPWQQDKFTEDKEGKKPIVRSGKNNSHCLISKDLRSRALIDGKASNVTGHQGTLEDWDAAVQKTESRLARVNEQRVKPIKRRKGDGSGDTQAEEEEEEEEEEAEDMETETGLFGRNMPPKADSKAKEAAVGAASSKWKETPKVIHDSEKDSVTVFVSNLSYNMAEPGATLKELFSTCGEVVEVRPIFNNKGNFRGYGYVEFKEEKAALEALKLDRRNVDGRLMFVSPCVDKTKHPGFKVFRYSTALEKHKLFIAGLPFSYTKEELEELCKSHGNVKDVRLVTNRAGRSKGMAYVEFENEAQASQAVLKMDGLVINDYTIKVAISNPPARKQSEKAEAAGRASQPMVPRQIYGARGKGRTQLAMVPRALQRQSNLAAKAENGTAQNPPTAPAPATEEPKKMSNADFARLLLSK